MIDLKSIHKTYVSRDIMIHALRGIDLLIKKGEFITLKGASGCGKSTLLNIIGLLDEPDEGTYIFEREDLLSLSYSGRTEFRKSNIGFIFQDFNLIERLNVFENIEMPLIYHKMDQKTRHMRVEALVERLGLDDHAGQFPDELSGGQQQRVAVARALAPGPKIILADEPTGNLDPENAAEVIQMLKEINTAGSTILMVTHSNDYDLIADRLVHMHEGEITGD